MSPNWRNLRGRHKRDWLHARMASPTTEIIADIWYRARPVADGRELVPLDVYPPAPNKFVIGEGRFNHHGQSLFYLARDEYGAATEVMRAEETRAWVQKFRIKRVE